MEVLDLFVELLFLLNSGIVWQLESLCSCSGKHTECLFDTGMVHQTDTPSSIQLHDCLENNVLIESLAFSENGVSSVALILKSMD